ncbi:MAG: HEAT repeat domain-containing protein [Candidatus Eisenbacteria bacterium]|uniref:HEAT repeat domain-containing protein n=1 Tax=Eiseniibacteriota bacterium TaxID=2212470 RepID=A0A956RN80_UNCEI|nr:HEAT repeat domain-containing protein [Candidatus Eisenbacteria bacterium]
MTFRDYFEQVFTLEGRVEESASVFSGIVVEDEWPWGRERLSVRPGRVIGPSLRQRVLQSRLGSLGLERELPIVEVEPETTDWRIDRHLVTLAVTARWKGELPDTVRFVTTVRLHQGEHWLIFTGKSKRPLEDSLGTTSEWISAPRSMQIELASYEIWHLPEPVWQHPTLSPWPLTFESLVKRLHSESASTVMVAARALGRLREREDEAAVVMGDLLMQAPADSVMNAVRMGMDDLGEPALPAFGVAMRDSNERVRRAAMQSLWRLGRRALPALVVVRNGLSDPDVRVRRKAAMLCSEWERDAGPAYEALVVACADPDPTVRCYSVDALAFLGSVDPQSRSTLLRLMDDPVAWVRAHAATGLGTLGEDDAIVRARLGKGLEDEDANVREASARGLHRLDTHWRHEYEHGRTTESRLSRGYPCPYPPRRS